MTDINIKNWRTRMRLEINDTRNNQKGVLWESLEEGCVYIDMYGRYILATDNGDHVVDLSLGELINQDRYDQVYDRFIPVKAKLEVFA